MNFADNNTESKAPEIDVLIGGDYYCDFVCDEVVIGESGPVARLTKLGYVLSVPIERKKNQSNKHVNIIHSNVMRTHCESKPELIDTKLFWSNEKIGTENLKNEVIKNFVDSFVENEFNNNEQFENHIFKSFCENIKFVDGNYEVKLPFIPGNEIIGDNYLLAKNRLKKLTEHFYENKDVLYEYDSITEYQKQKKIIEKAPENNPIGKCYYLPHHPVIRPEKFTTKIRMVFDARSKSGGEKSLNECLYPRPSLTAELLGALLRISVFNVAVVGDIEKAFLQISLNSVDRDYVRFLWFSDVHKINFSDFESNKFVEYRFCRELFGVVSYPFLLSTTIISHITHFYHLDPKFVVSLLNSIVC